MIAAIAAAIAMVLLARVIRGAVILRREMERDDAALRAMRAERRRGLA